LTLAILGDGNFFGEVETFSTGTRHVYAQALEDTVLCVLSKSDLEFFMKERPQLALKMIRVLSERLREAEEMLEKLAYEKSGCCTCCPSWVKISGNRMENTFGYTSR
jgi:CRP/FNR family transcriptional regulator